MDGGIADGGRVQVGGGGEAQAAEELDAQGGQLGLLRDSQGLVDSREIGGVVVDDGAVQLSILPHERSHRGLGGAAAGFIFAQLGGDLGAYIDDAQQGRLLDAHQV